MIHQCTFLLLRRIRLFVVILCLAAAAAVTGSNTSGIGSTQDPSSCSNVDQFAPIHASFDIGVNFDDRSTSGFVTHTLRVLQQANANNTNVSSTVVYLDVWDGVEIEQVEFKIPTDANSNYTEVTYQIATPNPNTGNCVAVTLPSESLLSLLAEEGTTFDLRFRYRTNADSLALTWMSPSQTAGKVLPFMYSLCQMNYCRDLAPMMDTPSQKITYDATIVAPKEFVVGMSANQTFGPAEYNDTHQVTRFACTVKIPSYLISIVVGDLVVRDLSDRVRVASEPALINAASAEFEDLPLFLDTAETYLGPYIWGNYTLLVMPPSFPWGGMEHPMITFASPTLITGDKSQVDVAIHEITHSWFGNDVGCENWNHFWLNEGLNVFMERKVTSILRGVDSAFIQYYTGNTSMYETMLDYGMNHSYTSLFPNIGDDDPENSFSDVPYEKGGQFAYYIETVILGEAMMQKMLQSYIQTFTGTSVNADEFREFYESFVVDNFGDNATALVNLTNYDTWVYGTGLPPYTLNFETDELDAARDLALEYIRLYGAGSSTSPNNYTDYFSFVSDQRIVFVQELASGEDSVDAALMEHIDTDLNITYTPDPRVKNEWYVLGITKDYEKVLDPTYVWIGEQGRNLYIRSIFEAMVESGRCDMAKAWYADYEDFYASYVIGSIERALEECPTSAAPNATEPTSDDSSVGVAGLAAAFCMTAVAAIGLAGGF